MEKGFPVDSPSNITPALAADHEDDTGNTSLLPRAVHLLCYRGEIRRWRRRRKFKAEKS